MRTLVVGYICVLWGGAVIGYGLTKGLDGHGSYADGMVAGIALGFLLFVAGGWLLLRRARSG